MDHGFSPMKICKSVADEDFISSLPEALKDKILCCLPIKEAVGTCLLSRNWRYTWASMTELMFRRADFASGNDNADDDTCRCNFNLSQFIASLSDVETIKLRGQIFECVEHEFLILKPPKLFNQLTKISLEINLGNLKEANFALCLFQHAPNLRFINLKLISRNSVVPTVRFWESIDRDVCLFQNVEVVVMFNFTGSFAELRFLKLLLKDAPVLRRVGISDKGLDRDTLKYLLQMRRASAEILIL